MEKFFDPNLNLKQKEAVFHFFGPSIILAGAGSGKTRVLTQKALYLIKKKGISPFNILMVTFTNKAAEEMKRRINYRLGFIGTFHSFGAMILRKEGEKIGLSKNFIIYDEDDQKQLIKKIIKNEEETLSPSQVLEKISLAKNKLVEADDCQNFFGNDEFSFKISTIFKKYQNFLEKNNAVDFDDLIVKTIQLFSKNKKILEKYQDQFLFILIDEFQDTNLAQYQLTKLLASKYKNITVVGDFSQSIYSWRGAEIENLKRFQKDFPNTKIFYLEKNYRSTQKILDFAFEVIQKNTTHPILKLYTDKKQGEEVEIVCLENEEEEGLFVGKKIQEFLYQPNPPSSIAVLYRMNAQSRILEEIFLHLGISYLLIGGVRFYERKEIKDILSFLRLLVNPNDSLSLNRIKKLGKKRFLKFKNWYQKNKNNLLKMETERIIGEIISETNYLDFFDLENPEDFSRVENIKELRSVALNFPNLYQFLEQVALVESEYFESEKKQKDEKNQKVFLMTLHQAKGLEFDIVFIVGVEERILPHSRSIYDLSSLEEERRLFYVGITRAKEKLFVTYTKKRFIFGRRKISFVSRFLENFVKIL